MNENNVTGKNKTVCAIENSPEMLILKLDLRFQILKQIFNSLQQNNKIFFSKQDNVLLRK